MLDQNKLKETILRISGVNTRKCMKCGKCSGTCPNYDEMEFHPHQFVSMIDNANVEPLLKSNSLYKCLSCMACVERCPRGVEPGKLIEAVRLTVIREKGCNYLVPDSIPEIVEDELPQQAIVTAFRKFAK